MDWQPIETAPKDHPILACMWGDTHLVIEFDEHADAAFPWATLDGPNYAKEAPTHWMALPPLPSVHTNS